MGDIGRGRPSKYNPDLHPVLARALAEKGVMPNDIAKEMKIDQATMYRWMAEYPDFCKSIKASKEVIDDMVEQALAKRALGIIKITERTEDEDGVKVVTKELPPDPTSMIFFLKNRRRELWRDKWEETEQKPVVHDPDLTRFKIFNRAFDKQQQVLTSKSKDIGLMCGRRAGKTDSNIAKALDTVVMARAKRVLIIGLTTGKTIQIYEHQIINISKELNLECNKNSVHGYIQYWNDSIIQFGGTSTKAEKEKYRGQHWDLIIIDEAQSQPGLGAFLEEIINPMLVDTDGALVMSGSGPRVRGTYWERYYLNPSPTGLRLNWNLSHNPHIHNYRAALQNIREKYGYDESDPVYLREYLGQVVYDDDALVLRMSEANTWNRDQVAQWIASQSPDDIRFVGGLDYGFRDSDAFIVVMYSERRNEKFVVYEYKANGADVSTLYNEIKAGIDFVNNDPLFAPVYRKAFDIYADTSDRKISMEFSIRYGLSILPAIKHDKSVALSMLQDEVRRGNLKVVQGGKLWDEAQKTVFRRIEQDGQPSILTREIDDELYHPDLMDATLYSLRNYWLTHNPEHHGESNPPQISKTPEQDAYFEEMDRRRNSNQNF